MRAEIACDAESDDQVATWRVDVTRDQKTNRLEQRLRLRGSEPGQLLERTLHRTSHDEVLAEAATWADELRGEEMACG
jgi:hypothetical protein